MEKLEHRLFPVEKIEINELLGADIESHELLSLHLNEARPEQIPKLFGIFRQGLRSLAKLMTTAYYLKNIQKIFVTSWIVTEHPDMFEKIGFRKDASLDSEKMLKRYKRGIGGKLYKNNVPIDKILVPPTCMSISREDFIERFGKKKLPGTD